MLDRLPDAQPLESPAEPDKVDQYVRAIWEVVCARSGRDPQRTCSSADFDLMYRWWGRRLPLRIVLRGIQDTKGNAPRVLYYRPSVEHAAEMWVKAVGPF